MTRPKMHGRTWCQTKEAHLPVHRWISKLQAAGLEYQILVVEKVERTSLAQAECEWISECRRQGVQLLNLTNGGEGASGFKQTSETIKKRSQALSFCVREPRQHKQRIRIRHWSTGGFRARAPAGKPLIDDLGCRYSSCGEAARVLGVDRALVRRVAQGKQKSVRGRTITWENV